MTSLDLLSLMADTTIFEIVHEIGNDYWQRCMCRDMPDFCILSGSLGKIYSHIIIFRHILLPNFCVGYLSLSSAM